MRDTGPQIAKYLKLPIDLHRPVILTKRPVSSNNPLNITHKLAHSKPPVWSDRHNSPLKLINKPLIAYLQVLVHYILGYFVTFVLVASL